MSDESQAEKDYETVEDRLRFAMEMRDTYLAVHGLEGELTDPQARDLLRNAGACIGFLLNVIGEIMNRDDLKSKPMN